MTKIKSTNEIIEMITEALKNHDGKFIEEVAAHVLSQKTTYLGDSLFEVVE